MCQSMRYGCHYFRWKRQSQYRLWQVCFLRSVSGKLPVRCHCWQIPDFPDNPCHPVRWKGLCSCRSCICRSVRTKGYPWQAACCHERTRVCRCFWGSNRCGSVCKTGSRRFLKRSAGWTSIHGNFLLSGMVCHGKEIIPGSRQLYFHGTDSDDINCTSYQKA